MSTSMEPVKRKFICHIETIERENQFNFVALFHSQFFRANVQSKDLSPYEKTKDVHATEKNLKKPDFREALDQIQAAARGEDAAPISFEVI